MEVLIKNKNKINSRLCDTKKKLEKVSKLKVNVLLINSI